jgi:hypothetical protein
MLDVYDAGGDQWTAVTELAREARRQGWWRAYGLGNTDYVAFEAEAARVQELALGFVPGLLQTPEYARALMRAAPLRRTAEEVDRAVAARVYRQRRLTSAENPLELVAVLDESVLHRPVGGDEVHRAQLTRLVAAAELPAVTLQVLPFARGAHAALASGFALLSFGDLGAPEVAFVEHGLGAVLMDKGGDVARARLSVERTLADALSPAESLAMVQRAAG